MKKQEKSVRLTKIITKLETDIAVIKVAKKLIIAKEEIELNQEKLVVLLDEYTDKTIGEIAEEVGISIEMVKAIQKKYFLKKGKK